MYGPTETTIWSSAEEVGEVEAITNIGLPLANQQLYVLDPQLQPVPVGAEGELWIGGMGVTRGYWQRPDLTADRFRPNPFGTGRIYGTGDLVRRSWEHREGVVAGFTRQFRIKHLDWYEAHEDVVKRVLAGKAPGNLIGLVRETFGLDHGTWGQDALHGDYPWLRRGPR